MLIAQFTTVKPEMAHSRTAEDFYKFLGENPTRLGIVAKMYPHLTGSFLTEGLGNIFYNKQKATQYQKIDSMSFQWEIDVNFIKRIPFASVPQGNGVNGSEITMDFYERYYEKDDTFQIEETKQQCIVVQTPIRKSDNFWTYVVRLIDPTYNEVLDATGCTVGANTRFLSNVKTEFHEEGYTKFQSNVERHRNWITEIRVDIDQSSRFASMENAFVKIANGDDGGQYKEMLFAMPAAKKLLLDNFMTAKNNTLLFQKTTMDVNGKSSILDKNGRPYIAGDGAIPQINRFAGKYNYNKLSVNAFNKAISTLSQKSEQPTGNQYMFICNESFYAELQEVLADFLAKFKMVDTIMHSKFENKIKVGAEFAGYSFMNNEVIFAVDRALSIEYPNKGYAVCIDLTGDKTSSQPAIQMFSIEGNSFKENTILGVGGADGKSSGTVSSPVAGSKFVVSGTAGIAVFTPYRSFILIQS